MELMKETRKHQAPITSAGSFEAFVNSTSIIALKETHIGLYTGAEEAYQRDNWAVMSRNLCLSVCLRELNSDSGL